MPPSALTSNVAEIARESHKGKSVMSLSSQRDRGSTSPPSEPFHDLQPNEERHAVTGVR